MRARGRPRRGAGAVVLAATLLAAPAGAYEVVPVTDGGTVRGTVRVAGRVPPAQPLAVTRDAGVCGEWAPARRVAVGPGGALRGAVVMLEGVARGKRPAGDTVIDGRGCAFVPPVLAAMAGTPARVKNSDPVVHNPRGWLGTTSVFNVALPGREQVVDITRRLARPGVVRLTCEVHPHMSGWLVIHDSPYVAVTDGQGGFRIDDVPPGTYRVALWYPELRGRDVRPRAEPPARTRRTVRVGAGASVTTDFTLR